MLLSSVALFSADRKLRIDALQARVVVRTGQRYSVSTGQRYAVGTGERDPIGSGQRDAVRTRQGDPGRICVIENNTRSFQSR